MSTAPSALRSAIAALDSANRWTGKAVAWLILPMVGSLVYEVAARYLLDSPTVWAYDMTFMLYGSFFMLGSAYTLQAKGHIRTDWFYSGWSVRTRGWVDAICYVLLFFPAMIAFQVVTWNFFQASWARDERVITSPWMPIIYPLKGALALATLLLLVQGISEFLKSVWAARTGESL